MGYELMNEPKDLYLTGDLLIAMPEMLDPRFRKSVIYICTHGPEGAMGLVINKPIEEITFDEVLEQFNIDACGASNIEVMNGGPVESSRGFVLHSPDYIQKETLVICKNFALTATIDILEAVARGDGPQKQLLALGYAGWGPGQLDAEILNNGWLNVRADDEIVFQSEHIEKWNCAMTKIGVDPSILSGKVGHA